MHDRTTAARQGNAVIYQAAIAVVVVLLVAITWMFTLAFTHEDEAEAEVRLEVSLTNLAESVQWQVEQAELAAASTLEMGVAHWESDPAFFDAAKWVKTQKILNDPAFQAVQFDSLGHIRSTSEPGLVGKDWRALPQFSAVTGQGGIPRQPGGVLLPGAAPGDLTISRPLLLPDGGYAGTLALTFDPWRGMRDLPRWNLGRHGVVALLRKDGAARFLLPLGEADVADSHDSALLLAAAAQRPSGMWRGTFANDGVQRALHYRRLENLDLLLVVGMDHDEAMRPTLDRSEAVLIFAAVVSVLLLIGAGFLIRQINESMRREQRLSADRTLIEQAYGELANAKANAEAKSAEIAATLAGMTDGVMMLDADLRLVNWNARFPERIGLPAETLRVGQSMEVVLRAQALAGEFGPVSVEDEVRRRMALMRATRGSVVTERARPDGTVLELRRSRLPGGGLVTLYIDVSARKRAEEALAAAVRLAEEAADQKSRFVAIVSHEIRTPLNAVINCLGLLDESDLAPSQRRLADTAREAGEALMELVNDILELSNAEAGKLELRPSVFDVTPLLEGVRAMFQSNASKRGVKLVLEVDPTLPRQIRADSGRLRQVMMNLVSNAGKFSSPGVVSIRAIKIEEDEQMMLRLAVEDQGPAIPPAEAAKLFVPFSRLRNARTSGAPGTGLGLAICDRLARAMGGRIALSLAATGGNEFALVLPLEAADTKPSLLPMAQSEVSLVQRRRARILIVEDIPANHLVAATLLRREGFRVDVAESGATAIAMVQRVPYDLVFMDLIMPEMDGLEATRRIRALQGQPTRLPVIALTATTSADDRARCIAAGMDDMLGKPIRPSALFGTVEHSLGNMTRASQPDAESLAPLSQYETAPILNEARLQELAQGLATATVISLVDQCLQDMRDRMPQLRSALAGTDARAIEIAAHALSGMSASYGFASLENRMRAIIRHARQGDLVQAAHAGDGMEGDLAVATEAVHLHLRAAVA